MGRTATPLPSQRLLKRLLNYDARSGQLFWRLRPVWLFKRRQDWLTWNKRFAGKPALASKDSGGYNTGRIFDRPFKAHRVIWKWVYGVDPLDVDHKNGMPGDDRLSNLRSATHSQNQRNRTRLNKNNVTGVAGVWKRGGGGFVAEIHNGGRRVHLGSFESLEEAAGARKAAEIKFAYGAGYD